jgi:hypothetical protein
MGLLWREDETVLLPEMVACWKLLMGLPSAMERLYSRLSTSSGGRMSKWMGRRKRGLSSSSADLMGLLLSSMGLRMGP